MKLTNLFKRDFEQILEKYNIGEYKSSKHLDWAHTNKVYLLKTTKGKFILKVFEKAEFDFIKFQNEIIDFLKNTIPTPQNILTTDKKFYFKYKNTNMTIQKVILGIHPKRVTERIIKETSFYLGKLDKKLQKIKIKEYDSWGNHIFRKKGHIKILNVDYKKDYERILRELEKMDFSKFKRGYIHADFGKVNILVKKNKLKAIIDWDDCHKDYYAYELAVFIVDFLFDKRGLNKKYLVLSVKEYEKNIKLSEDEKKVLYYLIKHRFISSFVHVLELKTVNNKWAKKRIRDYNNFNKISLEEFIKLL